MAKTKLKTQTLQQVLKRHDEETRAKGETLPADMRAGRLEVVEGFLFRGVPLKKIDHLRHLLERNNFRLTSSSHLTQLVPLLLKQEIDQVKEDLKRSGGRDVSVIFDGTTRQGEAIAILVLYVDTEWQLRQKLVRLDVVAKSVTAADLAQVLQAAMINYTLHCHQVLASIHDGVSVASAAMDHLRVFYPHAASIICMSHTIDNVGKHFDTPCLNQLFQW